MDNQAIQPIPSSTKSPDVIRSNKRKLTWGLICLIGPTAFIVVSIILYAVINFITAGTMEPTTSNGELFASPSTGHVISNVLMFLVGAISIVTWLPGVIVGIILLTSRK